MSLTNEGGLFPFDKYIDYSTLSGELSECPAPQSIDDHTKQNTTQYTQAGTATSSPVTIRSAGAGTAASWIHKPPCATATATEAPASSTVALSLPDSPESSQSKRLRYQIVVEEAVGTVSYTSQIIARHRGASSLPEFDLR